MADLAIRLLTEWADLERHAEAWDRLVPVAPHRNLFLSLDCLRNWWKHSQSCHRLHVLALTRGDEIVGFVPLARCVRRRGMITFRTLELLGGESNEHATVALPPDHPEAVSLVFDHLLGAGRAWDVLWLSELWADDPNTAALEAEARRRGLWLQKFPSSQTPYLEIDRPFEELWQALFSSKSRNTRLRKLRALEREPGYAIHKLGPGGDVEALIDAMAAVERDSWKGEEEIGIFAPENLDRHRDLIRFYHERGQADLRWVSRNGQMVSYRIGFIWGDVFYDFNTAYLPEVAKLSPSNVLLHLAIEEMAGRGIRLIDFCRGIQRYKFEWATGIHRNCLLRIYNRTPRGLALRGLAILKRLRTGGRVQEYAPPPIPLKGPLPPPGTPAPEPAED